MLRVGVGESSLAQTSAAVAQAAEKAMSRLDGDADLALVFATAEHWQNANALLAGLRAASKAEHIVGCSGAGVLTQDSENDAGPGIAVLALASDTIQARPFLYRPLRARERGFGPWLRERAGITSASGALLALFPDSYNGDPRALLQGVGDACGNLPVVGAGCSENGAAGKTYQMGGGEIATNAVAGLAFTGAFHASVGITQGCQPVAAPVTVTKAEGRLILELDGRPAFEVFAGLIGAPLLENLRRALAYVFVGVPADRELNRVGPGEYLARNIIGIDPRQGILAVSDEIFEGEKIVFTLRDGQRAREDLVQMLQRQAQELKGKKPGFGLYFDCLARGRSLYGIPGIDTAYIRNLLGDFPLIGFFGNFELGPLGGRNQLLAYTGVLALIDESEP
ncbi:MAG TPA: FIST N-terminal domain-containing protein [Candidatus Acidoferrales bacterium]|nr:FIST N-terminal domain-containing protein [Candidatus Acidoferrales bacterium]